jgi:hypothetical protein
MDFLINRAKRWTFALMAALLLAIPGAGLKAEQPAGFVLLSAGKDGAIGTPDDLYVTGKGGVVKGRVDLNFMRADLVPSSEAGPRLSVVVMADESTAPADGKTAVTITAEVRGQNGGLAPDGTEVAFSTTLGVLSSATATTSGGLASVMLVSAQPGTAVVTASYGEAFSSLEVEFYDPVVVFQGGTASGSSYCLDFTPDKAFDGDLSTWWTAPFFSGWVQYSFNRPVTFSSAKIVTSVSSGTAGRNSGTESVALKASADGVNWAVLGSQSQPYSKYALYREFTFAFSQATAQYIRIEIARSADWVTMVDTWLYR